MPEMSLDTASHLKIDGEVQIAKDVPKFESTAAKPTTATRQSNKNLPSKTARSQPNIRGVTDEPNPFGIDFTERIAQLRLELDLKHREEQRLIKEIGDKMNQTNSGSLDLNRTFGLAVSRLNNALLLVETDTKQLANTLKINSKLADNISSKVSSLDQAKTRVVECLQLASDMRDLGTSSEQVDAAISGEDFEAAAQHILIKKSFLKTQIYDSLNLPNQPGDPIGFRVTGKVVIRHQANSG